MYYTNLWIYHNSTLLYHVIIYPNVLQYFPILHTTIYCSILFQSTYLSVYVDLLNVFTEWAACRLLCRLAVLVRQQFSDVCPVQTASITSVDRLPHFESCHLWCEHLHIWLLQRHPGNIQYLQRWRVFNQLDLDLPGKSHIKTIPDLKHIHLK